MKSYAAKADASKVPRVCTFGIGKYANHYFLKMLASIGRGHNGETFVAHTVQRDMMELLQRCKVPILTDIAVGLPSQMGAEVYPFPIPDLFAGAPVMIGGKISGGLPPGGHCRQTRRRVRVAKNHPGCHGPAEQRGFHPAGEGVHQAAYRHHDR